jgi:uncharacterized protein (TIGR03435 family)
MRGTRCIFATLLLIGTTSHALRSQGAPTFEVASVKVNRSGLSGGALSSRANGFTAINETVRQLVIVAYGTEFFRVLGGPDWIASERFDVQARTATEVPVEDLRLMLRALLADRFRLVARTETRQLPIYELVVSADGGPGLRPAAAEACVERGSPPAGAGRPPACGVLLAGPSRMTGRSVTMDLLAKELAPRVRRVVVNRSERAGNFDVDLEWTADDPQITGGVTNPDGPPGIYTALPEQLGLRLRPAEGPVEVVVISGAERPTDN